MTARDLQDLELCYAPPFGAARDPVNFAGMVAGNIMDGLLDTITPLELIEQVSSGDFEKSKGTLLDVRPPDVVKKSPIGIVPEAQRLNIELEFARRTVLGDAALQERLRQGPIVVSCMSGQRAHVVSRMLQLHGFKDVKVLSGAVQTYNVTKAAVDGRR
eukprot:SRR837773.17879.p2 GENE.SRR837773.17879~~SRR837773.17879.p2  ORF type:complete len:159 (+),score=72.33 SRR837773.17879:223-699(+)